MLIAEADGPVTYSPSGCFVVAGVWNDPYTGLTFTHPTDVDIDHLVPLANAHHSGGWQWTTEQKRAYANDVVNAETLIAVDDGTNSSKGDQSPDQWMPPNATYWCMYAIEWVNVKATWDLTVTSAERTTLNSVLSGC
ncbi:MAG: HNH endonuclease family protein [Microbacteriaceae bacterium]